MDSSPESQAKKRPLTRSERNRNQYLTRTAPILKHRYQKFADFIAAYKLERGCIDCGYRENSVALEFDHRDPSMKRKAISAMFSYSREHLLEELDKCDVRCANCHRIKTHRLKQSGKQDPTDW